MGQTAYGSRNDMKLFQVIREGSLWGVYAVNANNPNDRKEVSNALTFDEQFAKDTAAELNRIAATYGDDETDLADLTWSHPPQRIVRFRD